MPLTPIKNAGEKYVNGLQLEYVDASTMTLKAGAARDATNTNDIVLESDLTLDTSLLGARGIDTGVVQSDAWYNVELVADSTGYNEPSAVLSLTSGANVALPSGYDMKRRVGYVRTGKSSTDINEFRMTGEGTNKMLMHVQGIEVISRGLQTSWTNIDLSQAIGYLGNLNTIPMWCRVSFKPKTAVTEYVEFRPLGSSVSSTQWRVNGSVVGVESDTIVLLHANYNGGNPGIEYQVSAAAAEVTIDVLAFQDNL